MIRIARMYFEVLNGSPRFTGLYEKLISIAEREPGDVIAFDETSLPEGYFKLLKQWLLDNKIPFKQTVEPNDALAKLQRAQKEQAEANAKAIEDAANARAAWYVSDQGMLDNDHNRDLLLGWFETNKANYTSHNIDLAVQTLADQIEWAVWSPRLQPVVETRTLANGEPELPIDATESVMRRASKAQLEDLSKRRGEFTGHRRGSFGSKFFEETVKRDRVS